MKPKVTNSSLLQQLQESELAFSLGKYEIIHKFEKKICLVIETVLEVPLQKELQ